MNKMMIAAALALLAFAGCRQTDERDFTVTVPALVQKDAEAVSGVIREALAGCSGIDMSSLQFDSENHCVKLRYDSMQIAKKNIEMAIAKVGFEANGVKPDQVPRAKDNAR